VSLSKAVRMLREAQRRLILTLTLSLSLIGSGLALGQPVQAQVTGGLSEVGKTIILPSTDPRILAARIINVALGLIGIILVSLILYAGFLYMTSEGETGKIDTAKKIITNAIIGLVIILSAWAITRYVISKLLEATTSGGDVTITSGGGLSGGFSGAGGAEPFKLVAITPAGKVSIRNIQIKLVFNRAVDDKTLAAVVILKEGGSSVGGTFSVSGPTIYFAPAAACPAPHTDKKCFDANADITVKVSPSLRSVSGQSLICSGFGVSCEGKFHTGTLVDTEVPKIKFTYPIDGQSVSANVPTMLVAEATDDSGVATVEFFDGKDSIAVDAPTAISSPLTFSATGEWFPSSASLGAHLLGALASDIDTNVSTRSSLSVMVRPAHCFNRKLDVPYETGIDCGGDSTSLEYCGACTGSVCTKSADCSSGACVAGKCVEQPVISSVAPLSGKRGTYVTINGTNFGTSPGTVTFLGAAGPKGYAVASAPTACVEAGVTTWSSTQVLVAVPDLATSGPIQLKNSSNGLYDTTNDSYGPSISDFLVDSTERPGLCAFKPVSGTPGTLIDSLGEGLGSTTGKIVFGKTELDPVSWSPVMARWKVPVVSAGPYSVSLKTGTGQSNPVSFSVLDKALSAPPLLVSVDPAEAPPQQYVTIWGKNLGYSLGKVILTDASSRQALGDISFPPACGTAFWRDERIVIKIPSSFTSGAAIEGRKYQLKIQRSDGALSNNLDFTITLGLKLVPGICAIEPALGPVGTSFKLYGSLFGTDKPAVTFSPSVLAPLDAFSSEQVKGKVPSGALTGPVTLTALGVVSNKVNFEVRNCNESSDACSPSEQCCSTGECRLKTDTCEAKALRSEYAWQTSTGLIPIAPQVIEECAASVIPSPTPWLGRAGGDKTAVTAPIAMRFSRLLEPTTVTKSAFQLYRCTSKSSEPCASKEVVPIKKVLQIKATDDQDSILLEHADFATSAIYLVTVSSALKAKGADGANMEVQTSCGKGPSGETYGYCFRFKTRDTTTVDAVGSVKIIPSPYTMHGGGETTSYRAVPLSASDACMLVECSQFNWDWYTGTKKSTDDRATVTNDAVGGKGVCEQTVTGLKETGAVPVDIRAEIKSIGPVGMGQLFIKFVPPRVEAYAPNCDQACSNSLVWARFSDELDKASVTTPGNIVIQKCFNENCLESELLLPPLEVQHIDLIPPFKTVGDVPRLLTISLMKGKVSLLESGGFYRVLLKGGLVTGIKGANGVPMTGLNHPQGFQWKFRVKSGLDAFCKAERVDVIPGTKFETRVDARQLFVAIPLGKPDACSAEGQALVPTASVNWASGVPEAADFYRLKGGLIDVGGKLPVGCSGKCLATGSVGVYGKAAVCGNGSIETTDSNYCNLKNDPAGKIPMTSAHRPCTVMPAGAQAGEACEPTLDGEVCDPSTCLFRPVKTVSIGTCGDGILQADKGEACDFGPRCVGGSGSISSPIPEYTACLGEPARVACEKAGGKCGLVTYRGCSANCRHLGSAMAGSICGNGALGDGEDCDDGNTTDGDGCSSLCLHEGSVSTDKLPSVCGNGVLEPGETCESFKPGLSVPAKCDPKTCTHLGTASCSTPTAISCCSNGVIDLGEDCDLGALNGTAGSGCSAQCLFKGSSAAYTQPSFCGNGIIESGEQCEVAAASKVVAELIGYKDIPGGAFAAGTPSLSKALGKITGSGDGWIDPQQLALIIGKATPDSSGRMSSTLSAEFEDKKGTAVYGLQCGFTSEAACPDTYGLDDNGCCALRPVLKNKYPVGDKLCRNVLLQAEFNVPMNITSVVNNFELTQLVVGKGDCPAGTKAILVEGQRVPGARGWLRSLWQRVSALVMGLPVYADKWCSGAVTGRLAPVESAKSAAKFAFYLDQALAPKTKYHVRFLGDNSTPATPLADNADPAKRLGIKTERGVVHAAQPISEPTGDLAWEFTTGDEVCDVNMVTVLDTTELPALPDRPHPYLFLNAKNKPETRDFTAYAQSIQVGVAVTLSKVTEYSWDWGPWTTSDATVVKVKSPPPSPVASLPPDKQQFDSLQKNGHAVITATLKIAKDTISVSSKTGAVLRGIAPINVLVCQSPWPTLETSPLRDTEGSPNFLPDDPFHESTKPTPQYFNFSTLYCRDAGVPNETSDDLPGLKIGQVTLTPLDLADGVLRQYLFYYSSEVESGLYQGQGLQKDGIGIRIVANPQHFSPEEWYASRGFTGAPRALSVDGYPAIEDGTTIYVAAANRPQGASGKIYSNIYLISHNQDAKPVTLEIFKQMVQTLSFNINPVFVEQSNVCVEASKFPYTNLKFNGGEPIACSADWDCLKLGEDKLHCDSLKLKLIRDTQRMADFQTIAKALEGSKLAQGAYPQAVSGTYLRNHSTSQWSSWQEELGKAVGRGLPVDPVNRFLTCGRCEKTLQPCRESKECMPVDGAVQACRGGAYVAGKWTPNDNLNPQSCWNQTEHVYLCPKLPTAGGDYGVSRIYQYRALSGGSIYELGAEFEVPPPISSEVSDWWSPPLVSEIFRCVSTSALGKSCASKTGSGGDDALCGLPVIVGACRQVGGVFKYSGICQGTSLGEKGVCGDGVLNPSETCEVGVTRLTACMTSTDEKGHKQQICDLKTCNSYLDDPVHPLCIPDVKCGNGRIDKVCEFDSKLSCFADADCLPKGGKCIPAEACDEGSLNGLYGHCNTKCDGYASYCGDGVLSGGETCDLGLGVDKNGSYCEGSKDTGVCCALDCRGPGPYCGDAVVNGKEECDGQTEVRQGAICSAGPVGKPCEKNTDCQASVCEYSAGQRKNWEEFHKILGLKLPVLPVDKVCSTTEECRQFVYKPTGEKEGSSISGECVLKGGICGGTKETVSCIGVKAPVAVKDSIGTVVTLEYETQHTRVCRKPGDPLPFQCTWDSWSGCIPKGSCGDGIKDVGEDCDDGSGNGDTKACTSVCKKNFCGDGKLFVGIEECDNGKDNGSITCSAEYGSMCLSCNKACKFMPTSGGYCGDGSKNGPEQCDAKAGLLSKDGAPITCQILGFDYGSTPIASVSKEVLTAISSKAKSPDKPGVCRNYRHKSYDDETGRLAMQKFITSETACAIDENCDDTSRLADKPIPTDEGGFLIKYKTAGIGNWYAADATCVLDIPACSSGCSFSGCSRCSDPVDPTFQTSISGTVRDGVFVNQPVPKARVTLLYQGIKVAETYTSDKGEFTLKGLSLISACSAYRIVVDFYEDNPKTTEVNEAINGGYWPYTSQPFAPLEFASKGIENLDGNIFLLPRMSKSETLVTVNWLGNLTELGGVTTADIDAHLVLPLGYAFQYKEVPGADLCKPDGRFTYAACDGKPGSVCTRDIRWSMPGLSDLKEPPHGKIYCYKVSEPTCESCIIFNTSPEVMKYSRKYIDDGDFYFYLVDFANRWQLDERNYSTPLKLSVNVVTSEGVHTFRPTDRPPINSKHNQWQVWQVFVQRSTFGEVKFTNNWVTKKTAKAFEPGLSGLGAE